MASTYYIYPVFLYQGIIPVPRHGKVCHPAGEQIRAAIESDRAGVEKGDFPTEAERTRMDDEVFTALSGED